MLKQRILSTLKFFDLQDYPLTLLELHRFLVADTNQLAALLDSEGEIKDENISEVREEKVSLDQILICLENDCQKEIETYLGFYCVAGKKSIIKRRLDNYLFGLKREKLIHKFTGGLRYLPFVRGVALAGSQAMGQERENSDIDLLIITDPQFLWLARTLVTAYFQMLGLRRHHDFIANRFCLNHYLAGPKLINEFRNFYTASEYLKLRPLLFPHTIWQFQQKNPWLKSFFPNADWPEPEFDHQPKIQHWLERLFLGSGLGIWLEGVLKNWQGSKIRRQEFIVVTEDELSFHPNSKQKEILAKFVY